jgi:hypothetical protein
MKKLLTLLCLALITASATAQQPERAREIERKLDEAASRIRQLTAMIESLRAELVDLKNENVKEASSAPQSRSQSSAPENDNRNGFVERIIDPELGANERGRSIEAKPEIFIQTRYSAAPIRNAGSEFEPNISLTRIEARWAGKVAERLGAGLEIQFHPALDGSPEELVNDAFIEYYINRHATLCAGQFIKPFGFDIQQSSFERESPERGIFAGYFFPGQRDRGVMLSGNLDFIDGEAFKNIHYFLGAFNGNRFFADNNRRMNFVARVRKLWPHLALGFSAQAGKQVLPEGVSGDDDETLIGVDLQYAVGRLGIRGELVAGNMPSTLLSIEPEFSPAFRPGAHSSGGHLFATYQITPKDNIYARYDQFNRDPVTGKNIRAFNLGYFRSVGEFSRLSFDYQFKNRPSFNDDALNGRFHITWNIEF